MTFVADYLDEVRDIAAQLDKDAIERVAQLLAATRAASGRVFVIGVGGSAANASHAVNDLRKLCGIEAYTPTDNVAELSARVNDDGWANAFTGWLRASRLGSADLVLALSVGGGSADPPVSTNLVEAIRSARDVGATVAAIVGRDGGFAGRNAHACVVVPTVNTAHVTPHTEAFQGVVLHLLVSHPALQVSAGRWETLTGAGAAEPDA